MKYNYLIVEDLPSAAENLKIAMQQHPDFECLGVAQSIKEAKSLIFKNFPKLIFLDVELGNESGFDLLKELRMELSVYPLVVMTTAHDHYAKEALNNEVLYFLSKPVDEDELNIALHRFSKTADELKTHLVIKDHQKGHRFIKHNEIIFLKSDNNYTHIKLTNNEIINVSKTLRTFEEYLPKQFVRIHRSYMLNINCIHTLKLNDKKIYFNGFNHKVNHEELEHDFLPIGENYIDNLKNLIL